MFKKCLKYDLNALRKIWLIAAAVMVPISLFGALGSFLYMNGIINLTAFEGQEVTTIIRVVTILMMLVGMLSLVVVCYASAFFMGGTSIMLYIRYFMHFFGDQGYLTFTLPVKRSTQFWSKTVSGMIYLLGSSLVTTFSVLCIVGGFALPMLFNPTLAEELGFDFTTVLGEAGWAGVLNALYILIAAVLILVLIFAVQFTSLITTYLLITLAATLFRNHKLLSVVIAYFGFGALMATGYSIGYFFIVIYIMLLVMFLVFGLFELFIIPILGWLAIYTLLLVACAAVVTEGLTLANFTMNRLERKLNLT